ncbi:hypothetical protein PWT90_04244 [Aphanocladium album]|nr:hypothetical protein PWT90_04244 [Aphanocladium album]
MTSKSPLRCPLQALKVTISIDGNCRNEPRTYTTGSVITGQATIHSEIDGYCEEADIILLGLAGTRLELTRHRPTRALSPFLKMYMTNESDGGSLQLESPFPGTIAAGETISIPFSFVVPQYLLEDSCRHPCGSQAVWERHSHLPPTLDGANEEEHEFLARGRIQYYVEMRLRCHGNYENDQGASAGTHHELGDSKIITGRQTVTILPALPELPPLLIDSMNSGSFYHSNSVVIRRHVLQRSGRLNAKSMQPPAMMLDPSGRSSPCSLVHLELEFRPIDTSCQPPQKVGVSGVALGTTYFCAEPSELLPELWSRGSNAINGPNTVQYSYAQTLLPLMTTSPAWHPQMDAAGGVYYTARLEMPLSLPACQRKPVLPTFYSCLISQTYKLEWIYVLAYKGVLRSVYDNMLISINLVGKSLVQHEILTELHNPWMKACIALAATEVIATPAMDDSSVDSAFQTGADSNSVSSFAENDSIQSDQAFELSEILPELFAELAASAKAGCMGVSSALHWPSKTSTPLYTEVHQGRRLAMPESLLLILETAFLACTEGDGWGESSGTAIFVD